VFCQFNFISCCVHANRSRKLHLILRDGTSGSAVVCQLQSLSTTGHNHATVNADALSLRRIDPETRDKFYAYFDLGMSAAAASDYHRNLLELDTSVSDRPTPAVTRYYAGASIHTQPTAASRRKQAGITRGSKRQLAGRLARGQSMAVKRLRNLTRNIGFGVRHAKSHGHGH